MNANKSVRMLKSAFFRKNKSGEVWQDKVADGGNCQSKYVTCRCPRVCANVYVEGLELPRWYLAVTVLSLYSPTLCSESSFNASCVFPALTDSIGGKGGSFPPPCGPHMQSLT